MLLHITNDDHFFPSYILIWFLIIQHCYVNLKFNFIYKFTWSSHLWCDVLLHNHFLCFCYETGHREKHFRPELAPSGNLFDFYTTVHLSVRPFVTGHFDLLTDSATPQKWATKIDFTTYLFFFLIFFLDLFFRKNPKLRICFFFIFFLGLKNKKKKWAEKSKATYLLLFYFIFLDLFFQIFLPFS